MRRPGRTIRLVFAASALTSVLLGCRAILGIHDYDDDHAGEEAGESGDGAIVDAPPGDDVDLLPDGAVPPCLDSGNPLYFSAAKQVAVGANFACALGTDLKVYCWGDDSQGQLGDLPDGGSKISEGSSTPVLVRNLVDTFEQIAVGRSHACALTSSGHIYCWGANQAGQTGSSRPGISTPGDVDDGRRFSSVAASGDHTCAVQIAPATGVLCWGDGHYDELGVVNDGGTAPLLVRAPGSGYITDKDASLAGGDTHECALLNDGAVDCWGGQADGQLANGSGDAAPSLASVAFPGIGGVLGIRAGGSSTCALSPSGIYCAGENDFHQFGLGFGSGSTPGRVDYGGALSPVDIAMSHFVACAWGAEHQLFCFGVGKFGVLGTGPNDGGAVVGIDGGASFGPVLAVSTWIPPDLTDPLRSNLKADGPATCAIVDEGCGVAGTVYCWGQDNRGQLGNGFVDANAFVDEPMPVLRGDLR